MAPATGPPSTAMGCTFAVPPVGTPFGVEPPLPLPHPASNPRLTTEINNKNVRTTASLKICDLSKLVRGDTLRQHRGHISSSEISSWMSAALHHQSRLLDIQ